MSQNLCIGIAGLGTVGGGLVEMLQKNHDEILRRTGREITIKAVAVHNIAKKRDLPEGVVLTDNAMSLADDPDIQVVVELMGGTTVARELILRSIENGKSVVTANKALLAEYGREIFALAAKKNVALGYEASSAGAIPVIQTLRDSLAGNHITSVMGILNGTSNYILSEMNSHGFDFPTALKEAQELGLAEADPSLDIDGQDAAHKLVLLIRLAWGVHYDFSARFVNPFYCAELAFFSVLSDCAHFVVVQPLRLFIVVSSLLCRGDSLVLALQLCGAVHLVFGSPLHFLPFYHNSVVGLLNLESLYLSDARGIGCNRSGKRHCQRQRQRQSCGHNLFCLHLFAPFISFVLFFNEPLLFLQHCNFHTLLFCRICCKRLLLHNTLFSFSAC